MSQIARLNLESPTPPSGSSACMIGVVEMVLSGGDDSFFPIYKSNSVDLANENEVKIPLPFDGQLDNLTIYCFANSMVNDSIITVRVNGSDSSLTTTVTASNTGIFSDITNTVSVSKDDLLSFKFSCVDDLNICSFSLSLRYSTT